MHMGAFFDTMRELEFSSTIPLGPIYRSAEGNRSVERPFLHGHTARQAIHLNLQLVLERVGTSSYAYGRFTGRPRIQGQTPFHAWPQSLRDCM